MTLFDYLARKNPILPINVIGNGKGLSNVPKGATGIVKEINKETRLYRILWENGVEEHLVWFGSVSLDLNVV